MVEDGGPCAHARATLCVTVARTASTNTQTRFGITASSAQPDLRCIGSFAPSPPPASPWGHLAPLLLQDNLHNLGHLVTALMLGGDTDDPARLQVGQGQRLLDEPCLPGLRRPHEFYDLRVRL